MSEEKKHEHGQESKTITIKRDTIWKSTVFILLVLLVVSIFTAGFGLVKPSGYATAGNNANAGAATNANSNSGSTGSGDTSVITADPNLFPQLGPANAKYTVIELGDFQCPYCAMASGLPNWTSQYASQYGSLIGSAKAMETLAEQGKIRFIFVPLSFLGQESVNAAQAGFCALQQSNDLFWKMHDAIYSASTGPQEDTGKYSVPNLEKIAAGISGMNTGKFNSCLENGDTANQVSQVMTKVQGAGFQIATPQFFVNGQSVTPSTSALMSAVGQ